MLQRVAMMAAIGAIALGGAATAEGSSPKLRQCGVFQDPSPSLYYAQGAVTCKTARSVAKRGLVSVQVKSSWSETVSGRRWTCRASSRRAVIFECKRPGSVVSLREG
jgi:hypothetical protein